MSAREQQQPPPAAPPEAGELDAGNRYEAVVPHWFYCKVTDSRERWVPFSTQDSERLEEAHGSGRVRTPWGGGCPPPQMELHPPPRVGRGISQHCLPSAPIVLKSPFAFKYLAPALKIAVRSRPGNVNGRASGVHSGEAPSGYQREIPRTHPRLLPGMQNFPSGNFKSGLFLAMRLLLEL